MQFAHPAALWLLLLLPALLLVRRHHPASTRQVGTLRFWREASVQQHTRLSRRPRITRRLLLQAAFLTTVIVALASPTIALGTGTVAIVVDSSLSMSAEDGGDRRIDTARARVHELLDGLPWGTHVRLIAADVPPRVVADTSASDDGLSAAVDALETTAAPADLDGALRLARSGDARAARTYVFTDAQKPAVAGEDILWTTVGRPVDNAAITALGARPLPSDRQAVEVLAEVTNFGSTAVTSEIVFESNGQPVSRQPLTIAAGSRSTASVRLRREPGILIARLDRADALQDDDVRHLAIEAHPPLRVLLVGRSYFLERALAAHPDVERADAEPSDVIVCAGCREAPTGTAGVILVPPGSGPPRGIAPLVMTGDTLGGAAALEGVTVAPLLPPGAVEESSVVARAGGAPVILASEMDGRRIVELRIDLDASPLALSPAFPMLVAAALEWVAPSSGNSTAVRAGDPLRWRLPGLRAATVAAPDGPAIDVPIANGQLFFSQTAASGSYRVTLADRQALFVVNPAADEESNLAVAQSASSTRGPDDSARDDRTLRTAAAAGLLALALALLAIDWRLGMPKRTGTRPGAAT